MLKLVILGSGSSGNCYFLETENEILILDCGIKFAKVKEKLHYDLSKVVGCLVTHEHGDHAAYIKDFLQYGIDCYGLKETFANKKTDAVNAHSIEPYKDFRLGDFTIKALPAKHDVPTLSYLITYKGIYNLFVTDSYFLPFDIKGVTNYIIEANYDPSILIEKVNRGHLNKLLAQRVVKSHLSIDKTIEILNRDAEFVKNIILIHLSDSNSNAEDFKRRVEDATGKPTYIAKPDMEIVLE